ncbi:MAG TPA: BON domain-containing protein [Gammaproteobacteria bacterium]|jgi:hyperosmotically inducible protein
MKRAKGISLFTQMMLAGVAVFAMGLTGVYADDATAPTAHSDSVGAAISDTDITAKVKVKLADKKGLKGSDISVTTTNAVVTLTGTAASSRAKSEAERLTKEVKGVKDVDDELTTPSGSETGAKTKALASNAKHEVSDSWITTKVKSELFSDSLTKGFDVKVVTTKGVVVLSGQLPNEDAVKRAKELAEKVEGVKSVNGDDLTVGKASAA